MLILNVSNSHLSTCSVGVGEGLQPRSKGTGQIARQVLQSYFILLNSVTISESRGSSLTRFSISSGMNEIGSSLLSLFPRIRTESSADPQVPSLDLR